MDWGESKFYLWLAVSHDSEKDDVLLNSIAQSFAFWKPEELPKILNKNRTKKMSKEDASSVVAKAERIKKMKFKETT